MKILLILAVFSLYACSSSPSKEATSPEECKSQIDYKYHFEMSQIEGDQIESKISHTEANKRKKARHELYLKELKACK